MINGDLLSLAEAGRFDVIVHGCNCFNTMGAGLAKSIKLAYPEAYQVDQSTQKGDIQKLGHFTAALCGKKNGFIIVNAYTQYHYSRQQIAVDYQAVKQVFNKISNEFSGRRIGYPKIGAGLAGGSWPTIESIINQALSGERHTLVQYAAPRKVNHPQRQYSPY